MNKFGYKPSNNNFGSVNVKDFNQTAALQRAAAANTADHYVIPSDKVPTKNQGSLSACAAFATTTALEIVKANSSDLANFEPLSPMFTYYNARVADNNIGMDDGSYIHNNFYSLESLGTCSLSMWKTDPKRFADTPSILAYKQANDNTVSSFHQISSSGQKRLEDVEMNIRAGLPVVWGTAVSSKFQSYMGDNIVFTPPSKSETIGLHATVLVGVRDNGGKKEFCLLNSWGDWGKTINGKPGFAWVSSDYLLDSNSADFFVAEAMNVLLV
jgi:C1A family cysteine protease